MKKYLIFNAVLFCSIICFFSADLQAQQGFTFEFPFKREIAPAIKLDYGWDNSSLKGNDKETLTNSLTSFGVTFGFSAKQDFFPLAKSVKYAFSNKVISDDEKKSFNDALLDKEFWGLGFSYLMNGDGSSAPVSNLNSLIVINPVDLKGTGYKFSDNFGLNLLTGNNMAWYYLGLSHYDEAPTPEQLLIYPDMELFNSTIRFGKKYQSEISLQCMRGFSIYGGANRMVIFPRTLFWKYLGSEIIYSAGGGVLNYFTGKIKTSNPYVYPAVDFILKTGLMYGISELQRSKMNWPINTAPPLIIDQYRVGVQFDFSLK